MSHKQSCPSCGKVFQVSDQQIGRKARCSNCSTSFIVGADSGDSRVTAAPAAPRRPKPSVAPSSAVMPAAKPAAAADPFAIKTEETPVQARTSAHRHKKKSPPVVWIAAAAGAGVLALVVLIAVLASRNDVADDELLADAEAGEYDSSSQGTHSQQFDDNSGASGNSHRSGEASDETTTDTSETEEDGFVIGGMLSGRDLTNGSFGSGALPGATGQGGSRIVIDWNGSDRRGGRVSIDGKSQPMQLDGDLAYEVAPGSHRVELNRPGYRPVGLDVQLNGGQTARVNPGWQRDQVAAGPSQPSGAGFEAWQQDIEAAKLQASREEKDILIAFTGSDWCGWSMRLAHEIFMKPEFQQRLGQQYVMVNIDLPETARGRAKIRDYKRNSAVAEQMGIDGYPTILFADGAGQVYYEAGYVEGGVPGFQRMASRATSVRRQRDGLLQRVADSNDGQKLAAAKAALKWLEDQELTSFYAPSVAQWYALAQRLDPDNQQAMLEYFFQFHWLGRVRDIEDRNAATIIAVVDELDAWTAERAFKAGDEGARLHLIAAMLLAMVEKTERAAEHVQAGLACEPNDPVLLARLRGGEANLRPEKGSGTGYVLTSSGYIMTNHHVIKGDGRVTVRVPGQEEPVDAQIVAQDEKLDMAVIKIEVPEGIRFKPIQFNINSVGRGAPVAVFGYPLGDAVGSGLKLTTGIVSGLPDDRTDGMLLLDCTVNPGNSGGPLCSQHGYCIGMVTAKSGSSQNVDSYGMARPAKHLLEFALANIPDYRATTRFSKRKLEWHEVDEKVSASVLMVLKMGD